MRLLIVGQNPSKKNTYNNTPFIGTKSGINLTVWLEKINLHITQCPMINCSDDVDCKFNKKDIIKAAFKIGGEMVNTNPDKILTLGNIAHKILARCRIDHFALPHPSGRNRKLNDKQWLDNQLKLAKEYIWS